MHKYHDNELKSFTYHPKSNSISSNKITSLLPDNNNVWVATDKGLDLITSDFKVSNYQLPTEQNNDNDFITSLYHSSNDEIIIGSKTRLFLFNKISKKFTRQIIKGVDKEFITQIVIDDYGNTWLATASGVYVKYSDSSIYQSFKPNLINFRIVSIATDNDNIWFGSVFNGLLRYSFQDKILNKYLPIPKDNNSIAGKSIMKLLLTKDNILYASSYNGGISYFNTNLLNFGFESNSQSSIHCIDSPVIYFMIKGDDNDIWLTTAKGTVVFNTVEKKCQNLKLNTENKEYFYTRPSIKDSLGRIWLSSTKGIHLYEPDTGNLITTEHNQDSWYVFALFELRNNVILIGTSQGVYKFSKESGITQIVSEDTKLNTAYISSFSKGSSGPTYIATEQGVAILNENDSLNYYNKVQSQLPTEKISIVYVDKLNNLWVGTIGHGLFQFNSLGDLLKRFNHESGIDETVTITSVLDDDNDNLWLGSDNGLIRLSTSSYLAHTFYKSDGLQSNYFNTNSAYKAPDGKLYFGGRNGYNAFYPNDITLNTMPPNIVLTDFTRFGKSVEVGVEKNGFVLEKHIDDIQELSLGHKDYVLGFEFVALDFADTKRNKYAYKLEGFDPDWTYVNADDRKAGYTNLDAGNYSFRVKGSNKDGTWNEAGKSLKIKVLPAPWLTWWAFCVYALSFLSLLFWYIQRKNKANIRINKRLRAEVKNQTLELNVQKQTVESLLAHKNELFANVSHEFRTPLTLILGPVNELLKAPLPVGNIKSLQMVNRNANRLLTMIEQLLQLAKITENQDLSVVPQQVHTSVQLIVDSFQPLAKIRNITLNLVQNDSCAIEATQDAIDTILSNLISNALKYTNIGGLVEIKSVAQDDSVTIEVTDNGCGLSPTQQKEIFTRFHRLDTHLNTEGVGIGLSLVQEVVKLNNGEIQVDSEIGSGSTFSVTFDCIDFNLNLNTNDKDTHLVLTDQLKNEAINRIDIAAKDVQYIGNKKHETILIIDDNQDMLDYIGKVLKQSFYCILVNRGKTGVAIAIKHVPDIIVCDVMMPEMDGFQVTRTIRSDTRTSHIPLILLTALNDKKSRIKGWRENIDVYLTKPFDADELILQLENILIIRNILKKKASQAIASESISMTSGLAKLDHLFIEKLMKVIEKNYSNPQILRPQLASLMAVSDRQLQRKTKALVDKNPLDLLREYRLRQAVKLLKDGYQVSQTSDMCGFNSVGYFSKCFNQQYGMNPKQYQQTCK